jgi:hypothetical protein
MSSSNKPTLKIDWATHDAAKYACLNWHYSKCLPAGKVVKIGAWENGNFIGVVLFSRGATPHIGTPYKLTQYEVCELTRIALTKHQTQVSRIISIAIRLLKEKCPKIRLIVSYADADQNHSGGIYKATNWIYEGLKNCGTRGAFIVNGKKTHPRTIGAGGGVQSIQWIRKNLDPKAKEFITKGKHKYLMPLDDYMRNKLKPLHKPYPKCVSSADSGTLGSQPRRGGAIPTDTLQLQNAE